MRSIEPSGYSWDGADGPTMLRALREASGLSQLEVAMRLVDAEFRIDQSHLYKIESGRIVRPAAKTIDAILTLGLQAPYSIRRDVLQAFGYRLPWVLPTEQEIASELRLCAGELNFANWPAYMMDYSHRIWAWNRLFPRLLGNTADDPANAGYVGLTTLDILLNPDVGTNRQIANAGSFVPLSVAWFKTMTRPYAQEAWFREFMARANAWPGFRELWAQMPEEAPVLWAEPQVVPVEIQVPGYAAPLRFRPMHLHLALDPRFSILHLVPLNLETMAICETWAADASDA